MVTFAELARLPIGSEAQIPSRAGKFESRFLLHAQPPKNPLQESKNGARTRIYKVGGGLITVHRKKNKLIEVECTKRIKDRCRQTDIHWGPSINDVTHQMEGVKHFVTMCDEGEGVLRM